MHVLKTFCFKLQFDYNSEKCLIIKLLPTYISIFVATDILECTTPELNNCHENATCTELAPGFSCACNDGYSGDGINCEGLK